MMEYDAPNPPVSPKTGAVNISMDALLLAAGNMLDTPIVHTEYQAVPLQGGTLGDVHMISGEAETEDHRTLSYRIVLKTQKQWERPGDPLSWRREYDLMQSNFIALARPSFRWPTCYHATIKDHQTQLWMEYINAPSGVQLTLANLERAAQELGRFQGRCHQCSPSLRQITCLSDAGYMRRDFAQWTPDTVEYRYLRSSHCALPKHLQHMLIAVQTNADAVFQSIYRLPQVLCHWDYWTENIFIQNDGIVAIDWDCAGFGAIGEDIASLIADETDPAQIGVYAQRLIPAYYSGLRETMVLPPMNTLPIRDMILLKFGYRFLQQILFANDTKAKEQAILALEQIYSMH